MGSSTGPQQGEVFQLAVDKLRPLPPVIHVDPKLLGGPVESMKEEWSGEGEWDDEL